MRARLWFSGTALIAVAIISWLSSLGAVPAPQAQAAENKSPSDDRDEIANKLMERVTVDKPLEQVSLKEALDFLTEKYNITLLVDTSTFMRMDQGVSFVALNAAEDDIFKRVVNLPVMKKVRLATVLKYICDQIEGVYLLYPDHIKLVGAERASTLLSPIQKYTGNNQATDTCPEPAEAPNRIICSLPLVNVNFVDRPLQEALREVEVRTNRSIALASQAGEKSKISITTRFTNVPVDTAVATLAEMAGLKMARLGNVLIVTTSERFKELNPSPPPAPIQAFMQGGGGFLVPNPAAQNEQIDDLKKKVAELERTIAEIKNKK